MNERATKAAIILLALGGSFGSKLIKEFKPDEIRKFAASAATLNEIDPAILGELVDEFSLTIETPALHAANPYSKTRLSAFRSTGAESTS